jgi:predicted nucleotidyltransferase
VWDDGGMVAEGIIREAARSLLAACPAGSRVILFGSHARGEARAGSDVDFLVIEPELRSRIEEAARLARVIWGLRVPADILVVSERTFEEWKDATNSVYGDAAREGRVLS